MDRDFETKKMFGLLLAAGESSRMGTPKQLLEAGGRTFVQRAIDGFLAADFETIVVVLGHKFMEIKSHIVNSEYSIEQAKVMERILFAENAGYKNGQFSSIKAGIGLISEKKAVDFYRGFMIQLIDRPLVMPETFRALKNSFLAGGSEILIPSYKMKRGHPACFASGFMDEIMAMDIGASLKDILKKHESLINYLNVNDPGVVINVDTPGEYEKLRGVWHEN